MSNPYTPWVLVVGAGIVAGLCGFIGFLFRRDNRMNIEGDDDAEEAGQSRSDEALHEYHHRIGDNHWKA